VTPVARAPMSSDRKEKADLRQAGRNQVAKDTPALV
jgi:hypothetical protein